MCRYSSRMDRGLLGWLFSLMLIGAVILAMVMASREGNRGVSSPRIVQNAQQEALRVQPSLELDTFGLAIAKLKLVWASLDGVIDEEEIKKIARDWKNAAESQVMPVLKDLVNRLRAGHGEQLMQEAFDRLAQESEAVKIKVLEEFGQMMQESGPLREQAAQLLGVWAKRLLGEAATSLWQRLGF